MSARIEPTCGKWMPRAKTHCARRPGHKGECRTAAALIETRQRKTARRHGTRLRDDPAVTARWRRKHKFVRLGITEQRFNELLAAQGHACAMCHEPFGDAFPNVDHDHKCCKRQAKARAKTCGQCIRGLLCFRCNTALGYIELYGDLARAYLDNPPARTA